MNLNSKKIVFIGAGSMAEAIIKGLISQSTSSAQNITATNQKNHERLQELAEKYGIQYADNAENKEAAIRQADLILLAMKPKDAVHVLEDIRSYVNPEQLIVSVIAGLSTVSIHDILGFQAPVVRTMPNTSSAIGLGATGICFSAQVNDSQKQAALEMFSSIGIVSEVLEKQMDIVIGVSGSGPAYIYYVMEAMISGGIRGGLSEEQSKRLVLQTIRGAVEMVTLTGEDPADLRRKVTSPNGTTQAALEIMDEYGLFEGIQKAVLRAAERGKEMGAAIADSINS